ncbi:Extracellular ligand-binding receptor [Rhodoferax ferrireducens T118]|uniref:Extracellular ligand-binding receptor n=1 Tax=Albidiferax ferrireducens (strain ATCC BAA-621 / DSM 15236 / T118) TaxID=338969 RepID=Q21ZQ5_ALBFT|nr:ABC transporter substrate-binding protein [Rhodoferax ferrireducens]ABD68748.1 Extracellular ligand-binding receptor [Rhodoferax ferrireducens T118]WPC67975.1 ABC transporter substrate-binding protein [Rhodoferax ferrireducens]
MVKSLDAGRRHSLKLGVGLLMVATLPLAVHAQKKYDTGASDTEIKIGNLTPYSGPASAYGACGKAMAAYFSKLNASGGINGRKVNFMTADDAYNPAISVEQTRKLVEQEEVLLMFASLGTSHNMAVQRYLNAKKIPQLFVNTGATRFGDPKNFPWTMGWQPTYQTEGQLYARHILATKPNAKIAVLMQNDDFGKDYMKGLTDGLGEKGKHLIVLHLTHEVTDPTIDSQMVSFKASGADVFVIMTTPKFAAQAIRKSAEIGWKPTQYLVSVSQSASAVLKPAGVENAVGVISSTYLLSPTDPAAVGNKDVAEYLATMKQYYPAGDPEDTLNSIGYAAAATMTQVLRQAGDNLTRENIMKQAASLHFTPPMLYPGIDVRTASDDFFPIEKKVLQRFNGKAYEVISSTGG